ncbi:MAG: ABC transporter ATP-binding protein [Marinilabiliaceae bacterium]|nr:ABC transporter ATP-binding protein [Marinilabiliaceae bacterium]
MQPIIQCNNITHYYGDRCIYENLNFEVQQGRVLGLLGKNGTGKTTIINILNGFLKPVAGTCRLFGEKMERLSPETKGKIGLLLEGHVQHDFFTVQQIEKYYSHFFKNWKREAYYELLKKLKVSVTQKISTMSCGQRSQVALGLLLAQDPELLILDDFSMGLDPGYRHLFVDYLREFAAAGDKTIFLTSHIIQDMEQLVDECIILDYGRILLHEKTDHIMKNFRRYNFSSDSYPLHNTDKLWNTDRIGSRWETYSFLPPEEVKALVSANKSVAEFQVSDLTLEEAFIGMTGKY